MYCSNCGNNLKAELNYCNQCGIKVSKFENDSRTAVAKNLSESVGYVGGFGLLGFIFVILILVKTGVNPTALVPISFLYLATLFGICFLLIRQSNSFSHNSSLTKDRFQETYQTGQFPSIETNQLEPPKEPVMSVTEATTKTFEEVLLKKN